MRRTRRDESQPDLENEPVEHEADTPLTPWDRVKIARNPARPHTLAYIDQLMSGFVELHGDRRFGDDKALIGGLARFAAAPSSSSATKKVPTPAKTSATTSGWPAPRATAKPSAS